MSRERACLAGPAALAYAAPRTHAAHSPRGCDRARSAARDSRSSAASRPPLRMRLLRSAGRPAGQLRRRNRRPAALDGARDRLGRPAAARALHRGPRRRRDRAPRRITLPGVGSDGSVRTDKRFKGAFEVREGVLRPLPQRRSNPERQKLRVLLFPCANDRVSWLRVTGRVATSAPRAWLRSMLRSPSPPPRESPGRFPLRRCRRRWRIERLFAWLQNYRRLITRHEHHAEAPWRRRGPRTQGSSCSRPQARGRQWGSVGSHRPPAHRRRRSR